MPSKAQGIAAIAEFAAHLPALFCDRLSLDLRPLPGVSEQEGFDLGFELLTAEGSRRVYVDIKQRWLHKHIDSIQVLKQRVGSAQDIVLLAIPVLSPRIRHLLRAAEINHVDSRGTLYLRAPGLYIDIEGHTPMSSHKSMRVWGIGGTSHDSMRVGLRGVTINPFSDRASIVFRLLCQDVDRIWRVDELAAVGETTPGWVSRVVRELEMRGYVKRSQRGSGRESDIRLINPVTALLDWAAVYSWRENAVTVYNVPLERHEIQSHLKRIVREVQQTIIDRVPTSFASQTSFNPPFAFTLLSASDEYAPHVQHELVHAYVGQQYFAAVHEAVQQQLHATPTTQSGNLLLFHPYYEQSVWVGARTINGNPVVSPIQLYLDLAQFPVRGEEAATMLARTVLGPELHLSQDQLQKLLVP